MARSKTLSITAVVPLITKAFKVGDEVALIVNSPGGSPTQSELIHDYIRAQADKTGKPVHCFVEDAAASGGYWIALAADKLYGVSTSIVGSIGVVSAGFGFVDAIGKLGIERRTMTAGTRKIRMDPFAPSTPEDKAWNEELLSQLHAKFIGHVRSRRAAQGHDLPKDDDSLFSGDVWLGDKAVENGLLDGLDTVYAFAERGGYKVKSLSPRRPSVLSRLFGGSGLDSTQIQDMDHLAGALFDTLESRASESVLKSRIGG